MINGIFIFFSSFATMMISSGDEMGWVQNMMGHFSIEMILRRYYKWKPRKTRNDGQAFRRFVDSKAKTDKTDDVDLLVSE
jgi:integrase